MLTREALNSEFWTKAFQKVTLKMAEQAESKAGRFTSEAFSSWLQDGPAKGLRRQHLLSRTAVGWAPTTVEAGAEGSIEHRDELDGLSEEQLDAVLAQPERYCTTGGPAAG